MILFIIVLLLGCEKHNYIGGEVIKLEERSSDKETWNDYRIVRDNTEWNSLCEEYGISDLKSSFGDVYFEDHSLIVGLFTWGYSNAQLSVKTIEQEESTIIVTIINKDKYGSLHACILKYWLCVIEFNKSSLDSTSDIVFNFETRRSIL